MVQVSGCVFFVIRGSNELSLSALKDGADGGNPKPFS